MSGTAMGSRAGSMLGHYRLLRLLGPGGFGEVYEAEDTLLHRHVALKLIAGQYSHDAVFRERLFREAQHAARLHDPHVVPIHGCGEIDGQLYIDMRLIQGVTLEHAIASEGPLDPPRAVALVRQVASALDAAHANQVVHRDVKPANVLITENDFACLVDFGLASAAGEAKLTSAGTTIGTFAYMAPERFGEAECDSACDIYALACVLYECLTGTQPYVAVDLPALISAHLSAPIPRPSQQRPDLPGAFDKVVVRGLAKDPTHRYASAGDLALAAQHALARPDQDHADTIVIGTQAKTPHEQSESAHEPIGHLETLQAPTPAVPPESSTGSPPSRGQRVSTAPGPRGRRRLLIVAGAVASIAIVVIGLLVRSGHRSAQPAPQSPASSNPSQLVIVDHTDDPRGLAVDVSGSVYIAEGGNDKVLTLPAGSSTPAVLRFTGLRDTLGLALDSKATVYVTDSVNNRVVTLAPGSTIPSVLPFQGLDFPSGVAVDANGAVYVTDTGNHRVLTLPAGSSTQTVLPFTGQPDPCGIAVDGRGAVYVTDTANNQVLTLAMGSTTPRVLPFTGLRYPSGVALDSSGAVYVTDSNNHRVLKLAAGSTSQTVLPFEGLKSPWGVAVDSKATVYVTDSQNNRVLSLPAPTH